MTKKKKNKTVEYTAVNMRNPNFIIANCITKKTRDKVQMCNYPCDMASSLLLVSENKVTPEVVQSIKKYGGIPRIQLERTLKAAPNLISSVTGDVDWDMLFNTINQSMLSRREYTCTEALDGFNWKFLKEIFSRSDPSLTIDLLMDPPSHVSKSSRKSIDRLLNSPKK